MAPSSSAIEIISKLPVLPKRAADSNKGTFGYVLVIAGSRGMSGAAVLAASAALRGGAGLVRLAVPEAILPIVAAGNPCYTTIPLPQDGQGQLSEQAEAAVLAAALILLGLAGVSAFLSIRLASRRSDNTVVVGLFMLAAVLGIAAIFTLTFLGKTRSG